METKELDKETREELDEYSEEDIVQELILASAENNKEFSNVLAQYLKENYDGMTYPRKKDSNYKKPRLRLV